MKHFYKQHQGEIWLNNKSRVSKKANSKINIINERLTE